jgi:hypothetical protein
MKIYQNDLEKRLAVVDAENAKYRSALHIHEEKKKVRTVKAKLVKKKLKSMISAMKCKHARTKQLAHDRKH